MFEEPWFWVAVAIVGGLLLGSIAGVLIRRLLDRESRRPALRQVAQPLSLFVFWLFVSGGLVAAVATSSPETLSPLPARILEWLPNLAVAGVILIAGYGFGRTISAAVGRSLSSATGTRPRVIERLVAGTVLGGAAILSLSQLGVDTTILNIVIAAVAFGAVGAVAGLAIVGGRRVAADLAAARSLEGEIREGDEVTAGGVSGTVRRVTATHLVLEGEGETVLLPFSAIDVVRLRRTND